MQTLDVPEGAFEDAASRLDRASEQLREATSLAELEAYVSASMPGATDAASAAHEAGDSCDREIDRVANLITESAADCNYVALDLGEVDARFEYAFGVELEG
ncbi:hypothetical protein [Gulosibacter bifidus]|uniref:Uncharacterized protein n=1 Tax=Gulosibacter bifidus TaxID=272239 RepID=A0ABW5RJG3_9MICO|nr:hypothetical protein [Gulosibacter bifidus]